MRTIDSSCIAKTVEELCVKANIESRKDILAALKSARARETSPKAKRILDIIIENSAVAKKKKLPMCQDTGMVIVYLGIGRDVRVDGDMEKAAEQGVAKAYKENYFRASIVKDPLIRKNTGNNLPAVINTRFIPGDKIDIRVVVKGFGCENAGKIKMFRPTDSAEQIEEFVVDTIKGLGAKACPPMYIGIGIGGTLDKAVSLSKEAIFRPVSGVNKKKHIAELENSLKDKINKLKIGPMGVGGNNTVLGVSILTYPTHIAGLPVAINVSCHATRDAGKIV
jgi:fumarate hydratase subunit alpha